MARTIFLGSYLHLPSIKRSVQFCLPALPAPPRPRRAQLHTQQNQPRHQSVTITTRRLDFKIIPWPQDSAVAAQSWHGPSRRPARQLWQGPPQEAGHTWMCPKGGQGEGCKEEGRRQRIGFILRGFILRGAREHSSQGETRGLPAHAPNFILVRRN